MTRWLLSDRGLIAFTFVIVGALMALAPLHIYSSGTYTVAFELADHLPGKATTDWGLAFVAAGAAALIPSRRRLNGRVHAATVLGVDVGLGLMLLVLSTWAASLIAAVIIGEAETWGGPLWLVLLTALMIRNIRRRCPNCGRQFR